VETIIDTDGQVLIKTINKYGTTVYRNNKCQLHRLGGPAIIRSNGTQFYYVDGIEYTKEQYPQAVVEYKLKQLVG
jgi:hypothetical protein